MLLLCGFVWAFWLVGWFLCFGFGFWVFLFGLGLIVWEGVCICLSWFLFVCGGFLFHSVLLIYLLNSIMHSF